MNAREKLLETIETALGTKFREATEQNSRDQIIGILREIEDGKDPHKSKRLNKVEEIIQLSVMTSETTEGFRDERDHQIWMMFVLGEVLIPKSERRNIDKSKIVDYMRRQQPTGNKK